MNLFLCTTPFQLFLAHKIAVDLKINKEKALFAYIGFNHNEAVKNSLREIEESGFKIKYIRVEKKQGIIKKLSYTLSHVRSLKTIIFKKYNAVYLASIEKNIFHFILSWIKFEKIFTFDDGTANIFPSSSFYIEKKLRIKTKIQNRILFTRYNMRKIKRESLLHYTVFKKQNNIIKNTKYILLFNCKVKTKESILKKSCSVIIGTVYREAFSKKTDVDNILTKCISHVKSNNNDLYYIPHPREKKPLNIENKSVLQPFTIAEKEIEKLLDKYEKIFIYGFMSTCQFNLESIERIDNTIFFSEKMKPSLKQRFNDGLLPSSFKIIEI